MLTVARSAWQSLHAYVFRSRAMRDAAIVGIVHFICQGIRFGGNIVLAALLSPAIFGLLGIVTAIRTGVELLTDIGISQSIIVSDDGAEQKFVETAWGLQIARGLVLTFLGAITAFPIAWYYGQPELGMLLLVGSLSSIAGAVSRPGLALRQRDRHMTAVAIYRLSVAVIGFVLSVSLAWLIPTAIGQTIAGVIGAIFASILGFMILPLRHYRPRIHPEYRSKIIHFGKWIFISSIIYFFASNFDRLYLPLHIPLVLFGVYNIARSLTDAITQLSSQVNRLVVLPAVARSKDSLVAQSARLGRTRFLGLAIINVGLGVMIAGSDLLITTIFDARYHAATAILPILLVGCWFSVHASLIETTLLGIGFPQPMVGGNGLRMATSVIGLPLALTGPGMILALAVLSLADLPRYFWLAWHAHRKNIFFGWQEPLLFLMTATIALATREFLVLVGLVDGFVSSAQVQALAQLIS